MKNKYIKILKYSNIVQYDDMGCCLRLCLVDKGGAHVEQEWIDTGDLVGDIECIWKEIL